MSPTVALIAEGDANTADCWSGSGQKFVQALREAGVRVDVYDAALRSWPPGGVAADPGAYAAVIPRWIASLLRGERYRIFGDGGARLESPPPGRRHCFVNAEGRLPAILEQR